MLSKQTGKIATLTHENEWISIKSGLLLTMYVTSFLCGLLVDLWPFMGFGVTS